MQIRLPLAIEALLVCSLVFVKKGHARVSFTLPDGFGVSVWACEPAVQNPIGMAWDQKGRMWVAENYTYAKRGVRFEMSLRDRVVVLGDEDGDGKAETRKVFTDKVQMLTSVEVGHGGVWLMCPPKLLFIPDADGDLVPDGEPEVRLDGFGVGREITIILPTACVGVPMVGSTGAAGIPARASRVSRAPPPNCGAPIDGGVWRYHPERKVVEVLAHGTVNPWGYDWDKHGELFFINTVIGHLHVIRGHIIGNPGAGPLKLTRVRAPAPACRSFSLRRQPALEPLAGGCRQWFRGRTRPRRDGHLSGRSLSRVVEKQASDLEPAWASLERRAFGTGGLWIRGQARARCFLNSDEWFRGMEVSVGPDGALYGLDWSDTGECHDHTGVHRTSGRIYKFHYKKNPVADLSALQNAADEPEAILRHPNAWFARRWLRLLLERRKSLERKDHSSLRETALKPKGTCLDPLACLMGSACDGLGESPKVCSMIRMNTFAPGPSAC